MPDPCHGAAPEGWVRTSEPGVCEYCGHSHNVRREPFGGKDACWPCWAEICFGGEDGVAHVWQGERCTVCGDFLRPAEHHEDEDPDPPDRAELFEVFEVSPCPECGHFGACGYDDQGRALIHAIPADDGED